MTQVIGLAFLGIYISTPMPLAGHDKGLLGRIAVPYDFYSHAPRGA